MHRDPPAADRRVDAPPRIRIEPLGAADLPRVQALARRIWPECFAGILPPHSIVPLVDAIYDLETLHADLHQRQHRFWIVRVDGEDAGYVAAYRDGPRLWIKKLYLLEACRGLGLGKRLIATALEAFPGVDTLSLYVNDANLPAIAFYRAQGFTAEAHVPVSMGPFDFHDYVMTRPVARG